MSFRFNYSGESSTPTNYELSNGQSLDLNTGDSLKLTNPDDIADMIPQGHDVLVLTKDGSSYLLKNFLLADNTELKLPDGTSINADHFLHPHDDHSATHADSGLSGINFTSEEATGSVTLQSVTLLSIISALSQNTSAFDEFKLNADGSENQELRNYFETLTIAALGETHETQAQAQIAELAAPEEENTLFTHNSDIVVDDETNPQTETQSDSNGDPSNSVTIDVTDTIDTTNFVDLSHVRFTSTVVNSNGEVVKSETVVDESAGTVEVVVDVGQDNAGNQVEVEVVVTDPTENDKVIDRAELAVVLPDPFNEENVTLSLSGSDVLENEAGYSIGSLAALGSEKDIAGPFTYRILSDQSGLFEIEGDTLKLKDGTAIDFETAPGKYEVSIRIENEEGTQIDRTLTLHPTDANDAPEIAGVHFDGTEDTSIPFERDTFEQAFSDVDGDDTLESVRIDSLPENGTLSLNGHPLEIGQTISVDAIATISFQPNQDWNGHTDFQWSGFDGTDWSAHSATVSIDTENINDAPVATFSVAAQTANEDAAFSFEIPETLFADIDAGDSLTLSANLPEWLSFDPETGKISGVPSYQNVGEHRIEITATDASGAKTTTSFTLDVENVNDRPTFTQIQDVSISEYDSVNIDAASAFSDEDASFGDTLSFSATLSDGADLPEWLAIDETSGKITGTPPQGEDTDLDVRVTATDNSGESVSNTFALHVENQNDAPELASEIADQNIDEDSEFSFNIASNFTDSDLADDLTYTATLPDGSPLPDWLSFDPASGQFSGIPSNDDVGMLTIQVTASDGSKNVNDFFAIMVDNTNDKPTATALVDQTATEDTGFSLDVSNAFSDIDLGDTLTYSATQMNGSELPDWLEFDEKTGSFSGTPENGDVGSISVLVVASDGSESANAIVSIEVENTNDGPVATFIPEQTAEEDAPFLFDVSDAFSDIDAGDELTYSATLENGDPLPEWLSINPYSGEITGTPENANVGSLRLEITANDGEASVSTTLDLTIENTNDGPVVSAGIGDLHTAEDSPFELDVSSNFGDPDFFDTLSFSATLENGDPLPDWLSFDPFTATFSGTPENGDVGTLSVRVVANDGEASISDVFTIEVENTNDRPIASANIADQAINEDNTFLLETIGNFDDVDSDDVLTFSATLEDGSPLPDWLAIDPETGTLSGTPENGDVGNISITVTATDTQGETADQSFSITIENTNDGPVANAIADQAAIEDSSFILDTSSSFSDVDANDSLSYSATLENGDPLPDWLTIDSETGTLSGTPENGDIGNIAVTVTATDSAGATASDTFGVNVANTNDGPVAAPIAEQDATEDAAFSLDISSKFSDEDIGDTLVFEAKLADGSPLPDWLTFDENTGMFSGIPSNEDVGSIDIVVTATDGEAIVDQTVTLNVSNTNDGPVATAIADQSATEDSAFNLDVSSNFSDVDAGDTLSYSATLENGDPLPDWLTIDSETGVISGTPENGDVGEIAITVTATDSAGETASDTFGIDIANTNDGPVATAIADQSASEDSAFNLDVSSSFSDVDAGDSLSYSATLENGDPLPDWLTIDSETGVISGTPENGDVGDISLTVTATDSTGATASDTFGVNVANTNDGPVATAIADQSATEDSAFNLDVSSSFSDVDAGDVLSYSATLENGDPLPDWLTIDSETGVISGTPENGDVGNIAITVTATDSAGATASDTFGIDVANTNDGPVATAIADQSATEDSTFNLDVSSNFSDVDAGDTLSYSATLENGDPLPDWLTIDSETGVISGTPENGDVGNIAVTVTATDSAGATASDTFGIDVANTNDGPVATAIADQSATEDSAFNLDVSSSFSDVDAGDSLSYSATLENGDPLPDWLTIDSETGVISGTPENGDVGDIAVTVTATDSAGATAADTFGVNVANTNDGPVATAIADQSATEDSAFNLDVSSNFSDVDAGDSLSYSATLENGDPLPDWLTIDSETGVISGTPENGDVGNIAITVTATDSAGATASDIFGVNVANTNDGPVATAIAEQSATEDSTFNLDVSSNFSDVDAGDTLSYSATLENGDPLPDWLTIDSETGVISGTPENGDVGNIAVTVTATDSAGATASDTFGVNVANTNDGPVATAIADQSATEDSAFNLDVSSNFSDVDAGDSLTYSATLENGDPLPDWLTIDSQTGVISGTPENGDVGDIAVTVTATDSAGATASDTFGVNVANTNDGPVATAIADQSATEDSTFNLDVSSNFSDVDAGDSLSYSATLENGDPLPDWLSIDSETGVISGTPENGDVGDIAVTVTATDSAGATAFDTFGIDVANTNDGPVATAIADQSATEDSAFNLDVSSSFSDVDAGDTLSYSATLENGDPLPDWLSIDSETGTLSGTPENGDVGDIAVTVTATDSAGATASDTFGIDVANTNDGPVATAIADQSATEDSAFNLDVSSNFSDVDAGDSLSYSATLENGDPLPDWLTIDSETGVISGTPENGDVGDIAVTVTATDSAGATASDTFGIDIANTNDGPVATAIADQSASEDSAFNLDVSSSFSDVDAGDTLSYSATLDNGDPLPDWLTIDSETGVISGTPENGDVGDIAVTVTATDSAGATASDTFGVNVANTNDGPVATAIADQSATEDSTFNLDVSSSFSDVDAGDTLSYSATLENGDPLPDWLTIDSETGVISGTPENGDVGNIAVTVTATDSAGATASDTFGIDIANTNDGPVATAIADQSATEDSAFNLDVSSNFSDVDAGDSLTYSATLENGDPLPDWLTIDSQTGVISGTPENGDVGDIAVTVTATDSAGATASDTFGVNVANTNDGPVATAIADQSATEDSTFNLDVSSNFSDVDAGDSLSYSATLENGDPLPDWLTIDSETGVISGTPENGDVGDIAVTVTATDSAGATASDTFGIDITNTNDAPTVLDSSQSGLKASYFNLGFNPTHVSDIDFDATPDYVDTVSEVDFSHGTGEIYSGGPTDNVAIKYEGNIQIDESGSWNFRVSGDDGFRLFIDGEEVVDLGGLHARQSATGSVELSEGTHSIQLIYFERGGDSNLTLEWQGPSDTGYSVVGSDHLTTPDPSFAATEDAAFTLDISSSFSDVDAGDTLTYSATLKNGDPLPDWLTIDSETGTLSGTPENGDVGDISVTVTATDTAGATASDTFGISVENTNDGPIATAIADQSATEDSAFNLDVSSSFSDVDAGDTLTYSATLEDGSDLPDWLSIDPITGELSGTPENGDVGDIAVTVTATDSAGETASDTFGINIANTNDGPVATAIDDQYIDRGDFFSLDVSSNFSDVDAGDTLTYSATLANGDPLPDWLSCDADTGVISGTPQQSDSGLIDITVSASDGSASTSDTFTIDVKDVVYRNGDGSSNSILGNDQNDEISGGKGSDTIDAGAGDDTIYGDDSPSNVTAESNQYIINGSFEDVAGGTSNDWGISKDSVSGWTEANGENFQMHIAGWEGMQAPTDGSYYLDMEETVSNLDISQDVQGLTEGSTYTLSFDAADRASDLSNSMDVYFGGQLIATIDPQQEDAFENYSFEVTGGMGDGSDTLRFVGQGTLDNSGLSLDNVQLTDAQGDIIHAGAGNDTVYAGEGDDIVYGEAGDDVIEGGSGDDTIDGGEGNDTLDLSGNRTDYHITDNGDGTYNIEDTVADRDGSDTVSNFESIRFADQTTDFADAVNHAPTDIAFETPVATEVVLDTSFNIGNGGGQDTETIDFTGADAGSQQIAIDFSYIDNSFELLVNGQSLTGETIQLQASVYNPENQVFLQFEDGGALVNSWIAHQDGEPRIRVIMTEEGVEVWGTRFTNSTTFERMVLDSGTFTAPTFAEGENTLNIINPDDHHIDGLGATVSATMEHTVSTVTTDESGNTTASVTENVAGAEVATLSSTDSDSNDTASYSIDSDPSGLFELVDNTLKLKDGASLDYETQSSHTVGVTVTDSAGNTHTENITVNVTDVADVTESQPAEPGQDPDVTYNGTYETETITTGSGDDTIYTGGGDDTVNAGDGNNTIFGNYGTESITTGSGNDTIYTGGGEDTVNAGDGNNTIFGNEGTESITTGSGDDTIHTGGGEDTVNAGDGNNTIIGDEGTESITSGSGDDYIETIGGNDIVDAGDGNNTILGSYGNEDITTGSGDDTITVDWGIDTVNSGDGADTIYASSDDSDTINTEGGDDTIILDQGYGFGNVDGGEGHDTLELNGSNLTLDFTNMSANSSASNIEHIDIGGTGANHLKLSAEDVLDMTDGNNSLFVEGNSDDQVMIDHSYTAQGTENIEGIDYSHYYDVATDTHLYIHTDITDTPTF